MSGSVCKLRAKLLSVLGLKVAESHSDEVGSKYESEWPGPGTAVPVRMIRNGTSGVSDLVT